LAKKDSPNPAIRGQSSEASEFPDTLLMYLLNNSEKAVRFEQGLPLLLPEDSLLFPEKRNLEVRIILVLKSTPLTAKPASLAPSRQEGAG
jgi:hypothetical protein